MVDVLAGSTETPRLSWKSGKVQVEVRFVGLFRSVFLGCLGWIAQIYPFLVN